MATSNDLLIKQRSVIEVLAAEGCSAANIHARMKTVYGEICILDCAVRKWVRNFKGEDPRETILRDRKRSAEHPSAAKKLDNRALFDEKVIGRRHCLINIATPSRVARHCIMSTNDVTQTCCSS
ncbi:transposase [Plakobranchus ocellatus]|uniref:Transposase n=1 Tax=Plakobranchus ocellatus TaxID=259542 RepID=A0AAV4CCV6_9GAST|nr:transposase [Plakobranchus ocellatus]